MVCNNVLVVTIFKERQWQIARLHLAHCHPRQLSLKTKFFSAFLFCFWTQLHYQLKISKSNFIPLSSCLVCFEKTENFGHTVVLLLFLFTLAHSCFCITCSFSAWKGGLPWKSASVCIVWLIKIYKGPFEHFVCFDDVFRTVAVNFVFRYFLSFCFSQNKQYIGKKRMMPNNDIRRFCTIILFRLIVA